MERTEAISCLKEILSIDRNLSPQSVDFQQNTDQKGYALHIKGVIQQSEKQMVEEIAKKHNLAIRQEQDGIVLFKPLSTTVTNTLV